MRERLSLLIEHFAQSPREECSRDKAQRLLDWGARFLARESQASDLVVGWDPALRQLFDTLGERAPELLLQHRDAFPAKARAQLAFALALQGLGPWPASEMPSVARRYLNCPEGAFAYEERIPKDVLAQAARALLEEESVPLMQWHRILPLLDGADDEFRLLILANYCGQDFRSRALELARASTPGLERLLTRALESEHLPFTGAIAAALILTQRHGQRWEESIPPLVRKALLWDLRCGNDVEASVGLKAYRQLSAHLAGELLRECLGEERAIALIPAVNDDQVIADLLARLNDAGSARPVVVESLAACGQRAVIPLAQACASGKASTTLAQVCIEVFATLRPEQAPLALVSLLGHQSRRITSEAIKSLERLEDEARGALEAGRRHTKKSVRTHCERLLSRLGDRETDDSTPLAEVRRRAQALPQQVRQEFLLCWHSAGGSEAAWQTELKPTVRKMGALALELLREWFEEQLQAGETRLWCYAVEELQKDPEAAWVAVDTFARMPKLSASLWARPRRALGHCGANLGSPIVHCLRSVHTEYRETLFGLLATHAQGVQPEVFVRGLSDGSQAVRTHSVDGLSRLADTPLHEVAGLLRGQEIGTRIAAAELLAIWGREEAADTLSEAWKAEKSAKVRPYLEDALVACGRDDLVFDLESNARLDCADVERFLSRQKPPRVIPGFVGLQKLPALRDCEGKPLSEEARHGLLARLMKLDTSLKGRVLRRLLLLLRREDIENWGRCIYEGWSRTHISKYKWAILQLSMLASDEMLDEAMSELRSWRGSERAIIGSHLRAAQWHGSERSAQWLGYWSENLPSRGARSTARQLLGRVAFKKRISISALRSLLVPFLAEEFRESLLEAELAPGSGREWLIRELKRSWLTRREWSPVALTKLLSQQTYLEGERLLWRCSHGKLCRFENGVLRDLSGGPVDDQSRLNLVHPLELSAKERADITPPLGQPRFMQQLDRAVHEASTMHELLGLPIAPQRFAKWRREQGWFHGEPMDAGIVYSDSLHLLGRGLVVTLHHSGYGIGAAEFDQEVRLLGLDFADLDGAPLGLEDQPPMVYSELHANLLELLESE